ncbi:MAG: hypothetical protein Q9194_004099 [Teloschistes cf. exilis]
MGLGFFTLAKLMTASDDEPNELGNTFSRVSITFTKNDITSLTCTRLPALSQHNPREDACRKTDGTDAPRAGSTQDSSSISSTESSSLPLNLLISSISLTRCFYIMKLLLAIVTLLSLAVASPIEGSLPSLAVASPIEGRLPSQAAAKELLPPAYHGPGDVLNRTLCLCQIPGFSSEQTDSDPTAFKTFAEGSILGYAF